MESISFFIDRCNEEDMKKAEQLKELLEKFKIDISLEKNDKIHGGYLCFRYDPEEVKRVKTRKAGGKRKHTDQSWKETKGMLTYGELQGMIQTEGIQEVASKLGISERTVYRRLAEHKKEEFASDNDWFF